MGTYLPMMMMAAGTITQAAGSIQAGNAAAATGRFNAQIARSNAESAQQDALMEARQLQYSAQIAEQDALLATEAAAFRQRQMALLASRRQGVLRAQIGASGVTMEGSPLQQVLDDVYQSSVEQALIGYTGELEALAHRREAAQLRYGAEVKAYTGERALLQGGQQAGLSIAQGNQARSASRLAALGMLASGGGKALYYGSGNEKSVKAPQWGLDGP